MAIGAGFDQHADTVARHHNAGGLFWGSLMKHVSHIVIVGGGIAGLSAAFALSEHARTTGEPLRCTLIERSPTWGGKIVTERRDGLVIEGGPDSFLSAKPWAIELCQKLGLGEALVPTNEEHNRTFAYSRGRLREIPQGLITFLPSRLSALVSSRLLSWSGLIRMGMEWMVPPRRTMESEESLGAFFRRRFGREAFERLFEPLVAGIYAGNADELSLVSTFPRFFELERRYGSLMRSALAQRRATKVSASARSSLKAGTMFISLHGGLGDLVAALVQRLRANGVTLVLGRTVTSVIARSKEPETYRVCLDKEESLTAESVVMATPAYATAKMLQTSLPQAATLLEQIPYASTATISLAYRAKDVGPLVRGFGFVVPRVEQKPLIAATWSSLKWPDRSPPDTMLLRCYVGGAGREWVLDQEDRDLIRYVREELRVIAGIQATPHVVQVYRWVRAMPQYTIGHRARLDAIRRALSSTPGLFVAGAAYEGLGIPDCIRSGQEAAQAILDMHAHRTVIDRKIVCDAS
ncbi:MAG: protoporphyrinogen oxidase [Nitrospirae bacterium]|nr:MAG: protoporphyrinogen oxidase [Nitrospirota bacterium]